MVDLKVKEFLKLICSIIKAESSFTCPTCGEVLLFKRYTLNGTDYYYYKCPNCRASLMISSKGETKFTLVLNLKEDTL